MILSVVEKKDESVFKKLILKDLKSFLFIYSFVVVNNKGKIFSVQLIGN